MAIGDGDSGRRRRGQRAGHPRNHHTLNPCRSTSGHLLEAATEHVRIAALETDDDATPSGVLDEDLADSFLRDSVLPRRFGDVDDLGLWSGFGKQLPRDEPIVNDDIRVS